MPHLEPTYLRYIYDGLVKGSIHPENAAELPEGLIGLYEEAFDERTSVVERQKLLQRFAIWALLKKEVSATFVAEVLGAPEEEILDFISTYSAWFNSPESGKYQLYHERLKVYLLQKLSEEEIHVLHEKLIEQLEQAIAAQKADEFEWYGLEFLTGHLGVPAMLNGNGKKLIDLAYSKSNWQRQLKISKGYTWTKNGLKEVMSWASKYNEEEVIECGLQMVDLHHEEQNAAPQIVALVAEGEFDAALKRIEQFGGNDKEGLQRKFMLYMLCLMELTLLESKEKPFRKEGIEKLLKHLDEQLPVDHSVLNWRDFFPGIIIFSMIKELDKLNINSSTFNKFVDFWEINWPIQNNYSESEFNILRSIILQTNNFSRNIAPFRSILKELARQGKIQFLLNTIQMISLENEKALALNFVASVLYQKKQQKKAGRIINEAIQITRNISNNYEKSKTLIIISSNLFDHYEIENAKVLLTEAKINAQAITDNYGKSQILQIIASELFRRGDKEGAFLEIDGAVKSARLIKNIPERVTMLLANASELIHQEKIPESNALFIEAKLSSDFISDEWEKSLVLHEIAMEMTKLYVLDEAIITANEIPNNFWRSITLGKISTELEKKGKTIESNKIMDMSLNITSCLTNAIYIEGNHDQMIEKNISELLIQGKIEKALTLVNELKNDPDKSNALFKISSILAIQGEIEHALETTERITTLKVKCSALLKIAFEQLMRGEEESFNFLFNDALVVARLMTDIDDRNEILWSMASKLNEVDKKEEYCFIIQEALHNIVNMTLIGKGTFLIKIASELFRQGKIQDATLAIKSTLIFPVIDLDDNKKRKILSDVVSEYFKHKKNQSAIRIANSISYELGKNDCLLNICSLLANQRKVEESLTIINDFTDYSLKTEAYLKIVQELIDHDNFKEAEVFVHQALLNAQKITDEWVKYNLFEPIIKNLAVVSNLSEALKTIELLPLDSFDWLRNYSLEAVINQLAEKGQFEVALSIVPKITKIETKCRSHLLIALELDRQSIFLNESSLNKEDFLIKNKINEAVNSANDLEIQAKDSYLADISILLVKYGELANALDIHHRIYQESEKSKVLRVIASECAKKGKIAEAIDYVDKIKDVSYKNIALKNISNELAKQCNWHMAEKIGLTIPQIHYQHSCWKEMAKNTIERAGHSESLGIYKVFNNKEARSFYLKSWVENLQITFANTEIASKAIYLLKEDVKSIQLLLQLHALNQLFFEDIPEEKIQRYNRTFNIQWAIDIKNRINYIS